MRVSSFFVGEFSWSNKKGLKTGRKGGFWGGPVFAKATTGRRGKMVVDKFGEDIMSLGADGGPGDSFVFSKS